MGRVNRRGFLSSFLNTVVGLYSVGFFTSYWVFTGSSTTCTEANKIKFQFSMIFL